MSRTRPSASLRERLLKTLLIAVLPALVVFAAMLFVAVRSSIWARFDADLLDLAGTLADLVEYDDDGYEFELGSEPEPMLRGAGQVAYLQVWDPSGATLSRTAELEGADLPRSSSRGPVELRLDDGRVLRAVTLEFTPAIEADAPPGVAPAGPVTLVLARETASTRAMLARLGTWFIGLVVLALAAAAFATAWAVRRGLEPVHAIASEIERIDARALSQRLDPSALPSEIQPIVRTTNALLDRLERAFVRERQLSSDVAHELRTPLGVLQTSLELGLRRERSSEEYRRALGQALADVRQLASLVGSLLELARLEGGRADARVEPVAIRALIDAQWIKHEPLARGRGLVFACEVPESLRVEGDADKLALIASNLLANAAQYTEAGGWIRVESEPEQGVVLAVIDSGPALSPEQIERVFDRFWRADAARSDAGVHCGIGLSLVRSLCDALGWVVEVELREAGALAFVVRSGAAIGE